MSLAEQALFLLDLPPCARNRTNPENFSSLDSAIGASLPGTAAAAETMKPVEESNPFSVATRMRGPNYETQAQTEALTQALRKIRASYASKASLTRSPG